MNEKRKSFKKVVITGFLVAYLALIIVIVIDDQKKSHRRAEKKQHHIELAHHVVAAKTSQVTGSQVVKESQINGTAFVRGIHSEDAKIKVAVKKTVELQAQVDSIKNSYNVLLNAACIANDKYYWENDSLRKELAKSKLPHFTAVPDTAPVQKVKKEESFLNSMASGTTKVSSKKLFLGFESENLVQLRHKKLGFETYNSIALIFRENDDEGEEGYGSLSYGYSSSHQSQIQLTLKSNPFGRGLYVYTKNVIALNGDAPFIFVGMEKQIKDKPYSVFAGYGLNTNCEASFQIGFKLNWDKKIWQKKY